MKITDILSKKKSCFVKGKAKASIELPKLNNISIKIDLFFSVWCSSACVDKQKWRSANYYASINTQKKKNSEHVCVCVCVECDKCRLSHRKHTITAHFAPISTFVTRFKWHKQKCLCIRTLKMRLNRTAFVRSVKCRQCATSLRFVSFSDSINRDQSQTDRRSPNQKWNVVSLYMNGLVPAHKKWTNVITFC